MLPTAHGSAWGECATAAALICSTRGMKRRQEQLAGEKTLEEASRNRETEKDKQNICRKSSLQMELKTNPGKQRPAHKSSNILYLTLLLSYRRSSETETSVWIRRWLCHYWGKIKLHKKRSCMKNFLNFKHQFSIPIICWSNFTFCSILF